MSIISYTNAIKITGISPDPVCSFVAFITAHVVWDKHLPVPDFEVDTDRLELWCGSRFQRREYFAAPRKKETWMYTLCFSDHGTVVLRGHGKYTVGASECEYVRTTSQKIDLYGYSMFKRPRYSLPSRFWETNCRGFGMRK